GFDRAAARAPEYAESGGRLGGTSSWSLLVLAGGFWVNRQLPRRIWLLRPRLAAMNSECDSQSRLLAHIPELPLEPSWMRETVLPGVERRLKAALTGDVRFDRFTRGRYATDASHYQIMPLGVVAPRTIEEANQAIAIAREEGVSVLARGAGTS